MSQEIVCRYVTYAPPPPKWYGNIFFLIRKTLELEKFRVEKEFRLNTDSPELFLQPGRKFEVEGRVLGETGDKERAKFKFEVVKWTFRFEGGSPSEAPDKSAVEATVKEVAPSLFETRYAKFSDGQKFALALVTIFLPVVVIGGGYYVLIADYPYPIRFWSFIGQHIRGAVA